MAAAQEPKRPSGDLDAVSITGQQLKSVRVEPVALHDFSVLRPAVGNVDYNQDRNVQVFAPYQGRIRRVYAKLGDDVKKGMPLFSIDSPDLVQAESAVISAAGVLDLTTRVLERLRKMRADDSAAQKDLDQATSDQQTAEGALRAARDTLRIFGKGEQEIDAIISGRRADGELTVTASIDGRITSRTAAVGLLLQPGALPPPFTLADISTMWVLGYVLEDDVPAVKVGNPVTMIVSAYPGRTFQGAVAAISPSVDPNTRRVAVRAEAPDPRHELLPQMLATMSIQVAEPARSASIPVGGVVREGDGSMTAWVTKDGARFERRTVRLGVEQDGLYQIVDGLKPGEKVAGDGALFLSTMATSGFGSGND